MEEEEPNRPRPDSGRRSSLMDMSQLTFPSFHQDDDDDDPPERWGPSTALNEDVEGTDAEELLCVQSMEFQDSHTSFVMDEGVPLPQARERPEDDGASGGVSSAETSTDSSDDFSNSADRRRAQRKKRQLSVGMQETLALRRIRVLLFFVTLLVVILGAIGMFLITQRRDIHSFEHSFQSQGAMILQRVEAHLQQQLEALDTLSTEITNFVADDTNASWPLVTLPHSASLLERYLQLMNAAILTICPIVPRSYREQWEAYSVQAQGWIDNDLHTSLLAMDHKNSQQNRRFNEANFSDIFQKLLSSPTPTASPTQSTNAPTTRLPTGVPTTAPTNPKTIPAPSEYNFLATGPEETGSFVAPFIHMDGIQLDNNTGPWAVWWQYAPIVSNRSIINYDMASSRLSRSIAVAGQQMAAMSPVYSHKERKLNSNSTAFSAEDFVNDLLQKQSETYTSGDPFGYIFYPVFNHLPSTNATTPSTVVAILSASFYWKSYFEAILPEGDDGMICVVNNTLGEVFTFQVDGGDVSFLGFEDLHDTSYDYLAISSNFSSTGGLSSFTDEEGYTGVPLDTEYVLYFITLYPSDAMKENSTSSTPIIVASSVVVFFALAGILFCIYDYLVSQRQRKVMDTAMKTHEIVSSLFPETVRDRMMQDAALREAERRGSHSSVKASGVDASKTIADFYPSATVLFSDITGFTAWCSEREPSQVFLLLESIYSEYDAIAKKRKVFKVETIGDCYMAVTGLPEPREDHALMMCRFARECLTKLRLLLNELEVTLGPGTADLSMRFGIHSGPVTAGVLRSQNARFQLFGDTVNTAARMESNGAPGMVHISQETANELSARGKSNWFYPRAEKITAKGKGELQTYWLDLSAASMDDRMSTSTGSLKTSMHQTFHDPRMVRYIGQRLVALADVQACRLVDWIVDTLSPMLSRIMTQRKTRLGPQNLSSGTTHSVFQSFSPSILDDVLSMEQPVFVPLAPEAWTTEPLDPDIKEQLQDFVHLIASLYSNQQEKAYHNLEHAAHVIMSVVKLLHRLIPASPDESIAPELQALFLDPVTPFACILAALVHDVEFSDTTRPGASVSNKQKSLQMAWALLIQSNFTALRHAIWGGEETELRRFQYLWARMVLATEEDGHDILCRRASLKTKKSSGSIRHLSSPRLPPASGALRLLEYVMLASDISHRMQHWHTYRKWTERRWQESGMPGNEKSFYEQELLYMDEYVLPLTEHLRDAWDAVRGRQHSLDDMCRAAVKIRDEWKERGLRILAELSETSRMSI